MIGAIITGFIVGLLARALMPGRDPAGFIVTKLLGIAGAFVAHLTGQALGFYHGDEPAGLIASVLGALLVLGVYGRMAGRRSTSMT